MKKHFMECNEISFTLGTDGLYYPDLTRLEGTHYQTGRYGRLRAEYVKKYHYGMYMKLLIYGKWNEYLHEIEEECPRRIDTLMEQMREGAGITEELKRTDQMKWVGLMNNIRNATVDIAIKEIIY